MSQDRLRYILIEVGSGFRVVGISAKNIDDARQEAKRSLQTRPPGTTGELRRFDEKSMEFVEPESITQD